jgi:hypothetical protein
VVAVSSYFWRAKHKQQIVFYLYFYVPWTELLFRFFGKSKLTSSKKGEMTAASWTFLTTRTVRGGLYQVRRWDAGS